MCKLYPNDFVLIDEADVMKMARKITTFQLISVIFYDRLLLTVLLKSVNNDMNIFRQVLIKFLLVI